MLFLDASPQPNTCLSFRPLIAFELASQSDGDGDLELTSGSRDRRDPVVEIPTALGLQPNPARAPTLAAPSCNRSLALDSSHAHHQSKLEETTQGERTEEMAHQPLAALQGLDQAPTAAPKPAAGTAQRRRGECSHEARHGGYQAHVSKREDKEVGC